MEHSRLRFALVERVKLRTNISYAGYLVSPSRYCLVFTSLVFASLVLASLVLATLIFYPNSQAALAAPASNQASKSTSCKGWTFSQQTTTGGNSNFVVTDDAIKIESITCGFTMIAKAPDWNICIFRPETKELGFLKPSQWHAWNVSTVGATDECTLEKAISKRAINLKDLNIKATQYLFPGERITNTILQTEKPTLISNYYVDAYQLSKAPQVTTLHCQLHNCPVLDGILIRCLGREQPTNRLKWFIHTTKLQFNNSIPASTFAIPKGYTVLKSINKQFKFKGMAGAIDEFGDMLDLGKGRARRK